MKEAAYDTFGGSRKASTHSTKLSRKAGSDELIPHPHRRQHRILAEPDSRIPSAFAFFEVGFYPCVVVGLDGDESYGDLALAEMPGLDLDRQLVVSQFATAREIDGYEMILFSLCFPLCSLCLCGEFLRPTTKTQRAQRKHEEDQTDPLPIAVWGVRQKISCHGVNKNGQKWGHSGLLTPRSLRCPLSYTS